MGHDTRGRVLWVNRTPCWDVQGAVGGQKSVLRCPRGLWVDRTPCWDVQCKLGGSALCDYPMHKSCRIDHTHIVQQRRTTEIHAEANTLETRRMHTMRETGIQGRPDDHTP